MKFIVTPLVMLSIMSVNATDFQLSKEARMVIDDQYIEHANAKEDAEDALKRIMEHFNQVPGPIGYMPEGRPVYIRDMYMDELRKQSKAPKAPMGRPDELKACVTKTTCVGQGKEKTCDSWEVCVSN